MSAQTSVSSIDVEVANVVPTLRLNGDAFVNEGTEYALALESVVDPGKRSEEAQLLETIQNEAWAAVAQQSRDHLATQRKTRIKNLWLVH